MSWLDKIKNDLIVITGDGKQYKPLWLNATKQKEYNVAEFDFPEESGTLVKRGKPMGRKYALELYFTGEDNLDTSAAFELSADDSRAWTLLHPYYGTIIVQPTSLSFDNSEHNVTKITSTVIETIEEGNPKTVTDPVDFIKNAKDNLDVSFEKSFTQTPSSSDIKKLTYNNNRNYKLSVPIITLPEEFEAYYNIFNQANSAINTATASPILAMRATIAAITYPSLFTTAVKNRLQLFTSEFNNLRSNIETIFNISSKQIYQSHGGSIISGMCLAAATPIAGDFTNSKNTLNAIDTIFSVYNQYIIDLDSIQTLNGGNISSFVADPGSLMSLSSLVYFTLTNLFNIALNGKKERTIVTEKDTNIILLTHRLYGLDASDNNINELMSNNNMGLSSILQIRKGTPIVYYI